MFAQTGSRHRAYSIIPSSPLELCIHGGRVLGKYESASMVMKIINA